MTDLNFTVFDTTIQKTNEILAQIEAEFNWQDRRAQAYSLLRETLHTLRDRLTVEKTLSLAAQLTLLLKGVLIDGWNVSQVPVKMNREEFIDRIQQNFNYSIEPNMDEAVDKVLSILINNIDESAREDLRTILPEDIAQLI